MHNAALQPAHRVQPKLGLRSYVIMIICADCLLCLLVCKVQNLFEPQAKKVAPYSTSRAQPRF